MEYSLGRMILIGLVLTVLVCSIAYRETLGSFFSNLENIGPGHTPEEQLAGIVTFLVIVLVIVGVMRLALEIIKAEGRRDHRRDHHHENHEPRIRDHREQHHPQGPVQFRPRQRRGQRHFEDWEE